MVHIGLSSSSSRSLMMKMSIERVCPVLKQYLHLILIVQSDSIEKLIIWTKRMKDYQG